MDLMNLNEELMIGKVRGEGKNTLILSPIARIAFPTIVVPEEYENNGKPRFSATLLFETDRSKPGAVDLGKLFLPTLTKFARANGLETAMLKSGIKFHLPGKEDDTRKAINIGVKQSAAGVPYDGYTPSTVYMTATKYPPKGATPPYKPVPCFSPTGMKGFDPERIYGGCWVRCFLSPYVSRTWKSFSTGLQTVQFLADGDPFGSDGLIQEMGAAPGATEPETDMESMANQAAETGDFSGFMGGGNE